METHPEPDKALSDGPNAWPMDQLEDLLVAMQGIDAVVKQGAYPEDELIRAAN